MTVKIKTKIQDKNTDQNETTDVMNKITESDKIWNEIKDLQINIFALPNQTVGQHVKRVEINTNELHLKLNSSAAISSLEEKLGQYSKSLKLETAGEYVIITRTNIK